MKSICEVSYFFAKMGHINIDWDTGPLYVKLCPTLHILNIHGT